MDGDDNDDLSGDGRILATGSTTTAPATTPAVAEESSPPAWSMFIGFVVLCFVLILISRWIMQKCCASRPPGPPPKTPGKVLSGVRFGSPVPYDTGNEIELNLLEPNDAETDEIDVVVDRTAKDK